MSAEKIEFQNVTFKHPSLQGKEVVKDFSEVFEANKSTAIFGDADADTSAIINLMQRFYDPQQGEISIGKDNICFVHLRSWRRCVGYVDRDPAIFYGTVRYNLQMAEPDASDQEMMKTL